MELWQQKLQTFARALRSYGVEMECPMMSILLAPVAPYLNPNPTAVFRCLNQLKSRWPHFFPDINRRLPSQPLLLPFLANKTWPSTASHFLLLRWLVLGCILCFVFKPTWLIFWGSNTKIHGVGTRSSSGREASKENSAAASRTLRARSVTSLLSPSNDQKNRLWQDIGGRQ